MGKILLNTANITCNNNRQSDIRAYVNGKIINNYDYVSKQVIMEYADTDFAFLIENNMEISDGNVDISLMREIRRYAKKYKDNDLETKFNDFNEYVSTTVAYLDSLEQSQEILQANRHVSSAVVSYDKALIVTTDKDSALYISGGNLVRIFPEDETERVSNALIPTLKMNDIIILLSDTVAKTITQNDILDRINTYDSAESIAQSIASMYSTDFTEEYSIMVILVKLIQDKSKTFMRSDFGTSELKFKDSKRFTAPISDDSSFESDKKGKKDSFWDEPAEDFAFADQKSRASRSSSFDSIKLSKNEKMKRRTSIYIKRAVSIILVLALMAGVIIGMVNVLKLIFNREPKVSESPIPSISPIVVESPSPPPSVEPSLEPVESKTPEPTPEVQFITHIVMVTSDHASLGQIARYYNETYMLNYPDVSIFVEVIAGYNEIVDVNMIYVGQEIKIPITPVP